MLTLPTTLFKLFQREHGDSGNAHTSSARTGTEQHQGYLLQRNEPTPAADAICKRSSASPGVATFKFRNTTTLEVLSHLSTNTVHKSEPR